MTSRISVLFTRADDLCLIKLEHVDGEAFALKMS